MNKEIVIKYLNNACSEAELSEFLTWLNSGHSDEILMEVSKSEWLALSENSADPGFENSNLILDKIHHTINTRNNNKVDLISEDENLKGPISDATFTDESLFKKLDLLKSSNPIDYKILRREKSDDGTFSKQQIVILENL